MSHQKRPSMRARDSSGKQVSLLNDDPVRPPDYAYGHSESNAYMSPGMIRSSSNNSAPTSNASSPPTPDLMRADSYDSHHSNGSHSPITPSYLDDFGRQIPYASAVQYKDSMYEQPQHHDGLAYSYQPQYTIPVRPVYEDNRRASYAEPQVYEEEPYGKTSKRYPCRFKDSHGCDRTFTTSGHASRHSKIHTAEKAVQCTFPGCQKKFTRADNMKQHLETHYKDRSRSGASKSSSSSTSKSSTLTFSAGVKKPQRVPSRASSRAETRPVVPVQMLGQPPMDPALFEPYHPPTSSSYNMSDIQEALVSQPVAHGLDALAAAAAQSQG